MTNIFEIKNDEITVKVNLHGAELVELKDNNTKVNYLWNGDSKYWGRISPILFPVIGACKNNNFRYEGRTYEIPKHGFARDMDFSLISHTKNEIWFELLSDEKTKCMYPFDFRLKIGYKLDKRKITVMWSVINEGEKQMHFSIGGHPAFMCPFNNEGKQEEYYIDFDGMESLIISKIDMSTGLISGENYELSTDAGSIRAENGLFDEDALVIENSQIHKVALLKPDKTPYVTVIFDSPLVGVWSLYKSNAPFICIEPWYGRCDSNNFNGSIEERDWSNALDKNREFYKEYTIEI